MAFLARSGSLFRNLLRKSRVERDLDAELGAHIDLLANEKMAAGMSPDDARRSACIEVGAEQVKEQVRDVRAGAVVEQFAVDLGYGLRMLRRNPGSSAVAILTLALGIGATTAIFSVVYGVLLRPLPYFKPDQIVELREVAAKGNRMSFADPNFEDVRAQNHCLAGMAEYAWWLTSVSGGSEPTRTLVAHVSRDFFPVMQVQPTLGRGFAPDDQRFGAAPVALVSYAYWKQSLGGATDFSQLKLTVENQSAAVVGVLPPSFRFPGDAEIWVPREILDDCRAAQRTTSTSSRGCATGWRWRRRAWSFRPSRPACSSSMAATP